MENIKTPILIVVVGPTGVGKTVLTLRIAELYGVPIISADSRQIYRQIPIGTAAPTVDEQACVEHLFVGKLELEAYYSAAEYEAEVIGWLSRYFEDRSVALMTGGSMMYIDAVCRGLDDLPTVPEVLRAAVVAQWQCEGLDSLLEELRCCDPLFYEQVDRQNPKRVMHAVEICRLTGKPFSSLRTATAKERPFRIVKIGLIRPREELYERINRRVDGMVAGGLIEEARSVYPLRACNSLNTVGYKELFSYFDGECTLEEALDKIRRNSRVYSRKQMTWFKRDESIRWFHPDEVDSVLRYITESVG